MFDPIDSITEINEDLVNLVKTNEVRLKSLYTDYYDMCEENAFSSQFQDLKTALYKEQDLQRRNKRNELLKIKEA